VDEVALIRKHYKPLCAYVDRTFVNSPSPAPWHEFFLDGCGAAFALWPKQRDGAIEERR
jgi:hypothetical protein